jgi:tetratricopeptide (TPR) repeat protein
MLSRPTPKLAAGLAALLVALTASSVLAAGEPRSKSAEDYFRDGVEHLASGRVDDAISSFRFCVDFKADQKECWYNLGVAWGRKRDFKREAQAYDRAIRLDPNYVRAHFNLAVSYEDLGKFSKALLHYDKAIAANPQAQAAHLNRAMLLLSRKKVDDAIAGFETAIKIKADNAEAWFDLAEALDIKADSMKEPARTKGLRRAISTYYKALQIDAKHHRAYYNIGVIHHRLQDYASEVAAYAKALALRPGYTPAMYNAAFAKRDKKDYGGALVAFEAYIKAADGKQGESRFVTVAKRELKALKQGKPGAGK